MLPRTMGRQSRQVLQNEAAQDLCVYVQTMHVISVQMVYGILRSLKASM